MFADIAKFVELKQNLQSCECPAEPAGPLRCIVQSASAPRTFRKGLGSALTLAQPLTRAYGVCTRARFSSQEQRLTTCVFVFCTVDCDDSTTTVTVTYPAVTVSAWTPFVAPNFNFGSSLPGRPVSKSRKKRLTTAALENND